LLLPKLHPSSYSHGGVPGRSIISNALQHRDSIYAYSIDISGFFPSIHYHRVYDLFVNRFRCSPDVARICTRLCTHDYHLAAGLPTSPILANQLLDRVDRRIGGACKSANLVYTRFVDDITISGSFDLEDSGIMRLVRKIVIQDGFMLSSTKQVSGKIADGFAITGIRIKRGKLDVRKQYIHKVMQQIEDAKRLVEGSPDFSGLYYTPEQIMGKVNFICSINPGRKATLMRLYKLVPWKRVIVEAERRGLIAQKKRLVPRAIESTSGVKLND
jgi:hypothetical protein